MLLYYQFAVTTYRCDWSINVILLYYQFAAITYRCDWSINVILLYYQFAAITYRFDWSINVILLYYQFAAITYRFDWSIKVILLSRFNLWSSSLPGLITPFFMGNQYMFHGTIHYTWPFSIAILTSPEGLLQVLPSILEENNGDPTSSPSLGIPAIHLPM